MRTGASILFGAFALSAIQRVALGEGSVTFAKDVAPILQRSCQNCHRNGSIAPMSLLTYKDFQAVKDQDKYVHDVILPKFKDILPKDKFQ
jgi:hypothetical protein